MDSIRASAIRIAGVVAPQSVGKAAFSLFCTPPKASSRGPAERRLEEKLTPLLLTAEAQRVVTSGAPVHAYLWRTQRTPSRGRILLLHGWEGRALVMLMFVKPLLDAGFDCVAFDLPAHGQSPGRRLNLPMGADAVLAVGDALGPFTGIVTHSLGGLFATLAIEGGAPMSRRLHVERLVLISSPNSLARLTQNFADIQRFSLRTLKSLNDEIKRFCGRAVDELNAGDFLRAAGVPTLVIHDEQDEEVPISEAQAILARAGSTAALMTTNGLGHRRIVVMPNVVRAAVRHLSS
jgi:pimeloyl-ACP methyl ester carboxylesterase